MKKARERAIELYVSIVRVFRERLGGEIEGDGAAAIPQT